MDARATRDATSCDTRRTTPGGCHQRPAVDFIPNNDLRPSGNRLTHLHSHTLSAKILIRPQSHSPITRSGWMRRRPLSIISRTAPPIGRCAQPGPFTVLPSTPAPGPATGRRRETPKTPFRSTTPKPPAKRPRTHPNRSPHHPQHHTTPRTRHTCNNTTPPTPRSHQHPQPQTHNPPPTANISAINVDTANRLAAKSYALSTIPVIQTQPHTTLPTTNPPHTTHPPHRPPKPPLHPII